MGKHHELRSTEPRLAGRTISLKAGDQGQYSSKMKATTVPGRERLLAANRGVEVPTEVLGYGERRDAEWSGDPAGSLSY
jgi:hypothetical protein